MKEHYNNIFKNTDCGIYAVEIFFYILGYRKNKEN